jgi:hypothetical protein
VTGFERYPLAVLEGVRANLLRGLDIVAAHVDAGTFDTTPAGKSSPPCQSGHLTLILLRGVDAELGRRAEQEAAR